MIKVLLILVGIVAILCFFGAVTCLLAASRENELPDIEDI
jgi:hypothetical protein